MHGNWAPSGHKSLLRERGVPFTEVDLNRGLTVAQLDALAGARDHLQFLNTRNELCRERGMKERPPGRGPRRCN